jgi:hypothetical protein
MKKICEKKLKQSLWMTHQISGTLTHKQTLAKITVMQTRTFDTRGGWEIKHQKEENEGATDFIHRTCTNF